MKVITRNVYLRFIFILIIIIYSNLSHGQEEKTLVTDLYSQLQKKFKNINPESVQLFEIHQISKEQFINHHGRELEGSKVFYRINLSFLKENLLALNIGLILAHDSIDSKNIIFINRKDAYKLHAINTCVSEKVNFTNEVIALSKFINWETYSIEVTGSGIKVKDTNLSKQNKVHYSCNLEYFNTSQFDNLKYDNINDIDFEIINDYSLVFVLESNHYLISDKIKHNGDNYSKYLRRIIIYSLKTNTVLIDKFEYMYSNLLIDKW